MQVVQIDTKGRALQHAVHVSKGGNEDMMWVALGNGGPWKITFDKGTPSPFSSSQYDVPQNGFVRTVDGPVNGIVGDTYKYNVRDGNNPAVIMNDPDVDIDP